MRTRLVRFVVFMGIFAASLTLIEGGIDRYLALYCAAWAAFGIYGMASIDDDLARERFSPPEPGADRTALRAIRAIALLHLVVGALDAGRWHLAPVAPPLRIAALTGMLAGAVLIV